MASIGPQIPGHRNTVTAADQESTAEQPEAGPSIGPHFAGHTMTTLSVPVPRYEEEEEEEEEEGDYAPELPPDLAAARATASGSQRRIIGPARAPLLREEEEESEDEIGPAPPPLQSGDGHLDAREDAVAEFMQKEAQRRQAIEVHLFFIIPEAARPKTLQRDEWMLVPPSSSDLLSTLDPTKLNKPRQFSRSTAPAKIVDNTLWTETPAEKQQRLADEVMGRKRRVENADPDAIQDDIDEEAHKRRRREAELQRQVDEYTRKHRGPSLIEARAQEDANRPKDGGEEPAAIWDHTRDMAVGGRLMDEKDRRRVIQDAKGLSERFGASKGGSFL
ncbi:hypothetical protein B0F90DRAFT_1621668 [Multifurca ochricompacta]|uniref:DUF3752 domain-containing protein n=1 Tax=Multifurca ochricompacta TaxID=376703 RepID=A0AAD4QT18_9AGAM|nr:hypothetical protein B0F90DRAFT_1621668 [Multifurca ochricompacta]